MSHITSTYLPRQKPFNQIAYTDEDQVKQNDIDWLSEKSGKSGPEASATKWLWVKQSNY